MKMCSTEEELRNACQLVENWARSLGEDCEIILSLGDVQVAPASWSGCVNEIDLFTALTEASKTRDG